MAILADHAHAAALPEQTLASRQEDLGYGMGIAEIVNSVEEFLKDKNAYVSSITTSNSTELMLIHKKDPSVPNKVVLELSTDEGGSCAFIVDKDVGSPDDGTNHEELGNWQACYLGGMYFDLQNP